MEPSKLRAPRFFNCLRKSGHYYANFILRSFQKQESQLEKLKKVLKPEEYSAATISITNREQRLENLTAQYQELEGHYIQIIERLAAA